MSIGSLKCLSAHINFYRLNTYSFNIISLIFSHWFQPKWHFIFIIVLAKSRQKDITEGQLWLGYLNYFKKTIESYVFTRVCHSFHREGGLQAHTQKGGWGVWLGGLQTQAWGGLQAHTQGTGWGVWLKGGSPGPGLGVSWPRGVQAQAQAGGVS